MHADLGTAAVWVLYGPPLALLRLYINNVMWRGRAMKEHKGVWTWGANKDEDSGFCSRKIKPPGGCVGKETGIKNPRGFSGLWRPNSETFPLWRFRFWTLFRQLHIHKQQEVHSWIMGSWLLFFCVLGFIASVSCRGIEKCLSDGTFNVILLEDENSPWSLKFVKGQILKAVETDSQINATDGKNYWIYVIYDLTLSQSLVVHLRSILSFVSCLLFTAQHTCRASVEVKQWLIRNVTQSA